MHKYYVYVYIDPRTMLIRYIGKGTRDRASVHVRRARQGTYPVENKRLDAWIKEVLAIEDEELKQWSPTILKIATGLTEQEAFTLEAHLIELHTRNNKNSLLNKKKGGTN